MPRSQQSQQVFHKFYLNNPKKKTLCSFPRIFKSYDLEQKIIVQFTNSKFRQENSSVNSSETRRNWKKNSIKSFGKFGVCRNVLNIYCTLVKNKLFYEKYENQSQGLGKTNNNVFVFAPMVRRSRTNGINRLESVSCSRSSSWRWMKSWKINTIDDNRKMRNLDSLDR